jgi:hypothetical protein
MGGLEKSKGPAAAAVPGSHPQGAAQEARVSFARVSQDTRRVSIRSTRRERSRNRVPEPCFKIVK